MASLVVSSGTAYYTMLRKVDDLRAVIERLPDISRPEGGLEMFPRMTITFTNLGNRSAAISSMAMLFDKKFGSENASCPKGSQKRLIPFDPLVLKPEEIHAVRIAVSEPLKFDVPKTYFETDFFVSVCLVFHVVTPDNDAVDVVRFIRKIRIEKGFLSEWTDSETFYESQETPVILYQNRRASF